MANSKISALTSATTPLAGTETLPIVQSSATKQVSVANLTAGRDVAGKSFTASTGMIVRGSFGSTGRAAEFNGSNLLMDGAGQFDLIIGDGGVAYLSLTTTDNAVSMKVRDYSGGADLVTITRSSGDTTINKGNLVIGTSGKGIDFSATPGTGTSELFADYEEGTWTPVDGSGAGLVLTVASASYTKVGRLVEASFAITFPATVSAATLRLGGLPFTSKTFGASMNTVSFSVVQYAVPITGVVDSNATTFIPLTYGAGTLTNANMSGLILRGTAIYEV